MKKILTTLMFVAILGLVIGSVSAADLQEHDFNGQFTLDVPGNYWMANANADGYEYQDGNGITVQYLTTDDINGATFEDYINSLGLKDGKVDGDFTVFQNDGKYVVITNSTDEMYIITDKDLEEAKAIAASADISTSSDNTSNEQSTPAKSTIDLQSKDFDDFKMDIPKDSKFEDGTDSEAEFNGGVIYTDSVNDINITFVDDEQIDDKFVEDVANSLENQGAKYSTNGNLYLIEAGPYNEVIFNNGTQMLMIVSSELDLDTLTAMAQSVEFTE